MLGGSGYLGRRSSGFILRNWKWSGRKMVSFDYSQILIVLVSAGVQLCRGWYGVWMLWVFDKIFKWLKGTRQSKNRFFYCIKIFYIDAFDNITRDKSLKETMRVLKIALKEKQCDVWNLNIRWIYRKKSRSRIPRASSSRFFNFLKRIPPPNFRECWKPPKSIRRHTIETLAPIPRNCIFCGQIIYGLGYKLRPRSRCYPNNYRAAFTSFRPRNDWNNFRWLTEQFETRPSHFPGHDTGRQENSPNVDVTGTLDLPRMSNIPSDIPHPPKPANNIAKVDRGRMLDMEGRDLWSLLNWAPQMEIDNLMATVVSNVERNFREIFRNIRGYMAGYQITIFSYLSHAAKVSANSNYLLFS